MQLVSRIEAVQEGEGDPSPENVRSITGWDTITVRRTGKNLLPYPYELSTITRNGITFTDNGDGTVTANGTATNDTSFQLKIWGNVELPAGEYIICGCPAGGSVSTYRMNVAAKDDNLNIFKDTFDTGTGVKIIANNGLKHIYATCHVSEGTTVNNLLYKPQLEVGNIATAYEPYRGTSLSAALPEIIYGGMLDWNTGVLTVTHEKDELNVVTSFSQTANNRAAFALSNKGKTYNKISAISDKYLYKTGVYRNDLNEIGFCINESSAWIRLGNDSEVDTQDKAQEYFEENPVTVIYELAEPYTIQFTPQQLDLLKGSNHLWSDCGGTDVTYIADTKLYIDHRIAAVLTAMQAITE